MELGWCPPKALCGSSIPPRESTYAAQTQMAVQVLGKDEMQGSIPWCGLNRERWLFGRRWLDAKTLFVAWRMAQGRELHGGLGRSMTKLGLAFEGRQHNAIDDAENTFRIYRALLFEFGKAPSAMTPAKLLETPARTWS
jgi:inhibitor of KinA sporulation pathway (predicted exonuclease)